MDRSTVGFFYPKQLSIFCGKAENVLFILGINEDNIRRWKYAGARALQGVVSAGLHRGKCLAKFRRIVFPYYFSGGEIQCARGAFSGNEVEASVPHAGKPCVQMFRFGMVAPRDMIFFQVIGDNGVAAAPEQFARAICRGRKILGSFFGAFECLFIGCADHHQKLIVHFHHPLTVIGQIHRFFLCPVFGA